MQYLVLLYGDETVGPFPGTPEWDAMMEGYVAFDELAGEAIAGGDALWDSGRLQTIHHDGESVRVTSGPFAETTEGLGGYYVLDAPSLDEVIELARNIPAVQRGAIELRPMVQLFDRSADRPSASDGATRYLATLHGATTDADQPGTPEWDARVAAHGAFTEAAGDVVLGGGAVQPGATATTIRVRDGELLVTDGPYSEALEVVGGYYVLHGSLEQVTEAAGRIPVNSGGRVEVREIMEMG